VVEVEVATVEMLRVLVAALAAALDMMRHRQHLALELLAKAIMVEEVRQIQVRIRVEVEVEQEVLARTEQV
jgi:hypothetical protein